MSRIAHLLSILVLLFLMSGCLGDTSHSIPTATATSENRPTIEDQPTTILEAVTQHPPSIPTLTQTLHPTANHDSDFTPTRSMEVMETPLPSPVIVIAAPSADSPIEVIRSTTSTR